MAIDQTTKKQAGSGCAVCAAWLGLFGLLGVLTTVLLSNLSAIWIQRNEPDLNVALMIEQIGQLKRGEIHCLVQPDPRFIDELFADPKSGERVCELYLGGDVSDERLGRLRELPNLKALILLFAENADILLERLQGMPSLEVLDLERVMFSPRGMAALTRFPKLKSFSIRARRSKFSDWDCLRSHPRLENLTLTRIDCDERLLPVLQSLPRLQSVTLKDADGDVKAFEQTLRKALPNCRCKVSQGS